MHLFQKTSRNRGHAPKVCVATVNVYDTSKILYVSKELAENYVINTSDVTGNKIMIPTELALSMVRVSEMCRHNKEVAEKYGRPDLVQCWSLAQMIAELNSDFDTEDDMLCAQNPFAKSLLESL